jgi:4-hydroxy-2-oxoglutarate aldolase
MNKFEKLDQILPPLSTPFEKDEVSIKLLSDNIKKYNEFELGGYVALGSNGESVFLTESEKLEIIQTVREQASSDKIVIAGTGSDSIKSTISLTNEAAKLGADFALIITPSFFKNEMKNDAFILYYSEVADKVKIPVIIYNVPKFTNVNIEVDAVAELSHHENIIGIKNSSEVISQTEQFVSNSSKDFKVLVGTASVLFPGLIVEACGGVLALANVAPRECIQILNLTKKKNFDEAKKLQEKMIPVNTAVTSKFGVAGLKASMDLCGYNGGLPRKPLTKLNPTQFEDLKLILKQADLIG